MPQGGSWVAKGVIGHSEELVLYADVFLPVRSGLVNKVEILGPNTRM